MRLLSSLAAASPASGLIKTTPLETRPPVAGITSAATLDAITLSKNLHSVAFLVFLLSPIPSRSIDKACKGINFAQFCGGLWYK